MRVEKLRNVEKGISRMTSKASESTRKNSNNQNNQTTHVVAEATLKPHERRSLLLGNFTVGHQPVGFTFEASPNLLDSIVTKIAVSDAPIGQRFVSYITNNAEKAVKIKVCQL